MSVWHLGSKLTRLGNLCATRPRGTTSAWAKVTEAGTLSVVMLVHSQLSIVITPAVVVKPDVGKLHLPPLVIVRIIGKCPPLEELY